MSGEVDLFGVQPGDLLPDIQRGPERHGHGRLVPCKRCMCLTTMRQTRWSGGLCQRCYDADLRAMYWAPYWDDVAWGLPERLARGQDG